MELLWHRARIKVGAQMQNVNLLKRITIDPDTMVGKPTIRGFRISVEQILLALSAGVPQEDLLKDFPELEPEDIRAALAYAAEAISEEEIYPIEVS